MINEVKRRLNDLEKNGYPLKRAMYIEKNPAREKEIRNIKKNMVDMFCNYHIGSNRKFFQ